MCCSFFSEEVTATAELDGIVAQGVVYPVGSMIFATAGQDLSDGFECGGKTYEAIHIPWPGLSVPPEYLAV